MAKMKFQETLERLSTHLAKRMLFPPWFRGSFVSATRISSNGAGIPVRHSFCSFPSLSLSLFLVAIIDDLLLLKELVMRYDHRIHSMMLDWKTDIWADVCGIDKWIWKSWVVGDVEFIHQAVSHPSLGDHGVASQICAVCSRITQYAAFDIFSERAVQYYNHRVGRRHIRLTENDRLLADRLHRCKEIKIQKRRKASTSSREVVPIPFDA